MSYMDDIDDDELKRDEWRRCAMLICGECKYVDFPGCRDHHVLYSRVKWDETETEAVSISCEVCENGTDGPRDPRVCRKCEKVKAKPNAWITSKRAVRYLTGAISGVNFKGKKEFSTGLVFCPDCCVVQFPGVEDTLLGLEEGKLWDEKKREYKSPNQCQLSFTHFNTECKGSLKVVQVELSKEQATYLRDHLGATAPLDNTKKRKTTFTVDPDDSIGSHLAKIFFDEKFSDVTILVGENKEPFSCHRLILAARSTYFRSMFYSRFAESKMSEVELPEVDPVIFNVILKTIYNDEIEIDTDNVVELMGAAKHFGVEALRRACVNFMSDGVDRENVLKLYESTADLLDEERFALKFIEDHAQEILLSDQFLDLSADSVQRITSSPALAIREFDLWAQVVSWGIREVKRREKAKQEAKDGKSEHKLSEIKFAPKSSIPTAPSIATAKLKTVTFPKIECDPQALRDVLAPIIHNIRFPLFKLNELGSTVHPLEVIDRGHMVALYMWCALPAKNLSNIPKGFPYMLNPREPRRPMGTPRLKTERFEDNTGIFYWIGTNEGKTTSYNNPIDGAIGARMSTTAGSNVRSLADRNYTSSPVENSYGSDSSPWIEFDFKKYKVRPTAYFLAQEQDHYVRNWRIEGSDDGTLWTTIRDHANDATLTTTTRYAMFDLPGPTDRTSGFWRRLRLIAYGPSHNGSTNFDITEMEWYGYIVEE